MMDEKLKLSTNVEMNMRFDHIALYPNVKCFKLQTIDPLYLCSSFA